MRTKIVKKAAKKLRKAQKQGRRAIRSCVPKPTKRPTVFALGGLR